MGTGPGTPGRCCPRGRGGGHLRARAVACRSDHPRRLCLGCGCGRAGPRRGDRAPFGNLSLSRRPPSGLALRRAGLARSSGRPWPRAGRCGDGRCCPGHRAPGRSGRPVQGATLCVGREQARTSDLYVRSGPRHHVHQPSCAGGEPAPSQCKPVAG